MRLRSYEHPEEERACLGRVEVKALSEERACSARLQQLGIAYSVPVYRHGVCL